MTAITKKNLATARRIARRADEGGIIQAADMVRLFPGRPTMHTTTRLRDAWRLAIPGVDVDALSEALWG